MTLSYLHVDQVDFSYSHSDWQLEHVSLNLSPGKLVGIIGPNGAGKSTLLKISAGLIQPSKGTVSLHGTLINQFSRKVIAKSLAYLPQQVNSNYEYTVEEIVSMGRFAHLKGACFLEKSDLMIVQDCLEQTQTTDLRHRYLNELSGGQKQRVLLASVLAQTPKVLLLDEPTTGLDMYHQSIFFNLLKSLQNNDIAIGIVTHDLNLAAIYCDELVLLDQGKVIIQNKTDQVICPEVLEPIYQDKIIFSQYPSSNKFVVLPAITENN